MSYWELAPHHALRPFVDRFWIRVGNCATESLHILPDGCIDVLVSERGSFVVGTMTRALVVAPGEPFRTIAVRFRPGGAIPFLRTSAHELTDRRVGFQDVGLRWLAPIELYEPHDLETSVRRLERALLARLAQTRAPDALVSAAANALLDAAPTSIAELAQRLGCSRQHLARSFKTEVGIGPKELAKVARLQRAVATVQRVRASLAQTAIQAGYFDEAHMDRDFRELAGLSPKSARSAPGSIRPILSLFAVS